MYHGGASGSDSRPARERRLWAYCVGTCLVLGSLALLFGVLEIGARVYLWRVADDERFLKYASYRQCKKRFYEPNVVFWMPHRYLGYMLRPGYEFGKNRHNSLGYRGREIVLRKPPGEFRMACIAGSTTYDDCIEDPEKTYAACRRSRSCGGGV